MKIETTNKLKIKKTVPAATIEVLSTLRRRWINPYATGRTRLRYN
jgi:hypothetical protein